MKKLIQAISIVVVALVFIFGLSYLSYESYKFFAPRYTAVNNQVFQQSQQYNEGMIRDLQNLQMEYINGDEGKKDALRAIVMHRFSVYPEEKMPADLRNFYNSIKAGK